jgi:hypothetical protein
VLSEFAENRQQQSKASVGDAQEIRLSHIGKYVCVRPPSINQRSTVYSAHIGKARAKR